MFCIFSSEINFNLILKKRWVVGGNVSPWHYILLMCSADSNLYVIAVAWVHQFYFYIRIHLETQHISLSWNDTKWLGVDCSADQSRYLTHYSQLRSCWEKWRPDVGTGDVASTKRPTVSRAATLSNEPEPAIAMSCLQMWGVARQSWFLYYATLAYRHKIRPVTTPRTICIAEIDFNTSLTFPSNKVQVCSCTVSDLLIFFLLLP